MCTKKRWITTSSGKRLFVNCGLCPSCLQEKAIKRADLVRSHYNSDKLCLFVTLTYCNDCVPYINRADLNANIRSHFNGTKEYFRVFRLKNSVRVRKDKYYHFDIKRSFNDGVAIGCFHVPLTRNLDKYLSERDIIKWNKTRTIEFYNQYPKLRGRRPIYEYNFSDKGFYNLKKDKYHDRIGVIWNKDIQDFFKRLRQNLKRKYNVSDSFEYFRVSEYGPKTRRPHFHLLLYFPKNSNFEVLKRAIAQSWPFDDYHACYRNIEIAKNPSSYLASYVNCNSYIPALFQDVSEISPSSSHSINFGYSSEVYSLSSFMQMYERRDFTIPVQRITKGVSTINSILFPKYLISRWFPKFHGFSRFTSSEVYDVALRPNKLFEFEKYRLGYTYDELFREVRNVYRCRDRFLSFGYDLFTFARVYSSVYTIYNSNLLKLWYSSVSSPLEFFYEYDNISDWFNGDINSPTLEDLSQDLGTFKFIRDPNFFPRNVSRTSNLEYWFNKYDKSKKVRNVILSNIAFSNV